MEEVTRPPAVLVDGAVAAGGEVLQGVTVGRLRIIEGIGEAGAFKRSLCNSVDGIRRLDSNDVIDRRRNVVHVRELGAQTARVFYVTWPGNDQRIGSAAQVGGILLGPLKGRTEGPGPGRGIMIHERLAAQQVGGVKTGFDGERLSVDVVRICAFQSAFCAGSVVTEDLQHNGVVRLSLFANRIEQPADLVVRLCGEARVDLGLMCKKLLLVGR